MRWGSNYILVVGEPSAIAGKRAPMGDRVHVSVVNPAASVIMNWVAGASRRNRRPSRAVLRDSGRTVGG